MGDQDVTPSVLRDTFAVRYLQAGASSAHPSWTRSSQQLAQLIEREEGSRSSAQKEARG